MQRAKLGVNLTPVTLESFLEWKKRKVRFKNMDDLDDRQTDKNRWSDRQTDRHTRDRRQRDGGFFSLLRACLWLLVYTNFCGKVASIQTTRPDRD